MQQNKTASQRKTINPACWVPTAYFAMGLPFIAINLVSVFMFKDLGISDTQIAFWTSLIMMPWTLKFLWSPFLEMYRTKKFFVLITELLSGVLFGVVAFSLFFDYFFAISISTMAVIAFSGYLPILDLRMVTLITDADDKLVCVGISMPSLAEALQKSHGRLLPLGWFYLLKALFMKRRAKMLDLLLVAVKPEYQNKGVNALLFSDLIPVYQKLGFIFAESNPELELNGKVQAQWDYFETKQHKRRRAFTKEIK